MVTLAVGAPFSSICLARTPASRVRSHRATYIRVALSGFMLMDWKRFCMKASP